MFEVKLTSQAERIYLKADSKLQTRLEKVLYCWRKAISSTKISAHCTVHYKAAFDIDWGVGGLFSDQILQRKLYGSKRLQLAVALTGKMDADDRHLRAGGSSSSEGRDFC